MIPLRVERPIVFTPFHGLLALAQRGVRALEQRTGMDLWDGEGGVSGVAADVLEGLGVKKVGIVLGADGRAISPRAVAEAVGLVKKRRIAKRGRR